MKAQMALIGVALLGLAGGASAQGPPIVGDASVAYNPTAVTLPPGAALSVDVRIDVTGVNGRTCAGATTPVALGGYGIGMDFDNTRIEYLGVSSSPISTFCPLDPASGTTRPDEFGQAVATNPTAANSLGMMSFQGIGNNNETQPVGGPFCYFRINLRARVSNQGTGVTTLRFRQNVLGSHVIISAPQYCAPLFGGNTGAQPIPGNPDSSVVLTTTPVTLQRFGAE